MRVVQHKAPGGDLLQLAICDRGSNSQRKTPTVSGEGCSTQALTVTCCRSRPMGATATTAKEKPPPFPVRVVQHKPLAVTCCGSRSAIATATTAKEKPPPFPVRVVQYKAPGGDLLLHGKATLPSAHARFTSEFGMGSGGTTPLWPPGKGWEQRVKRQLRILLKRRITKNGDPVLP